MERSLVTWRLLRVSAVPLCPHERRRTKGSNACPLTREAFGQRFQDRFYDRAFEIGREALERIEQISWMAYYEGHKARRPSRDALVGHGVETDLLDLSLVTSNCARHIHPSKGCGSTAMPLCHWRCSCYANHGHRQTYEWRKEIYERWACAGP